jgi:hypothetical protein
MKKQEFITAIEKLSKTDLIRVAKKGEHANIGGTCIGSTFRQNEKIWRTYGTLNNIVIFKTADEVNAVLEANNITEFKAFPTKSKTMSRLRSMI